MLSFLDEMNHANGSEVVWTGVPLGDVFYVSPNGSDSNPGNRKNPLATITAALALCVDGRGDTVFIGPGVYAENLVMTKSGVKLQGAVVGGVPVAVITASGSGSPAVHLNSQTIQGVCLADLGLFADANQPGLRMTGLFNTMARVERCRLHSGGSGAGIVIEGGAAIRIRDCDFYSLQIGLGLRQDPTIGEAPLDIQVSDCSFRLTSTADIATLQQGVTTLTLDVAILRNLTAYRCRFSSNSTKYINIQSAFSGATSDNVFYDCWFHRPAAGLIALPLAGFGGPNVVLGRDPDGLVSITGV